MKQPADTPFPHTPECKTPDAEPQWMALGKGSFERICTCHREVVHWRQRESRPDPLDPKNQRHRLSCALREIPDIAEKPEVYTAWVKLKVEPTYTFATCNSCGHNWYVYDDQSRQKAGASR